MQVCPRANVLTGEGVAAAQAQGLSVRAWGVKTLEVGLLMGRLNDWLQCIGAAPLRRGDGQRRVCAILGDAKRAQHMLCALVVAAAAGRCG